jgi:hypothetical protein
MGRPGTFKISYNVDIMTIDKKTRKILSRKQASNLLTESGLEKITKLLMHGFTDASYSILAIGTDNTSANASDIELGSEYTRENAVMEYREDYMAAFTYEFSFTENVTIWEVGILDSYNNMLNHYVSDEGAVVSDSVTLSVEIVITVAPDED